MNKLYLRNDYGLSFASVFSNQRGSPPKYASRESSNKIKEVTNKRLPVQSSEIAITQLAITGNYELSPSLSIAIP